MMLCPWMGKECLGVDACAPAAFSAVVGPSGQEERQCPIVCATDTLRTAAVFLFSIIEKGIGVGDGKQGTDGLTRQEIIDKVVRPDQLKQGPV